mmetsp:Transcript_2297/g.4459  ORF Transcript_2297/g.4459 Transcript_2297/m.4459 type:complete len:472 (+) Transcript_2297:392-1807(+)
MKAVGPHSELFQASSAGSRWLIATSITTFMGFAISYAMDCPASLHDQGRAYFGDARALDYELFFNLLYVVFFVPNILLAFVGGVIIDRYGDAKVLPWLALAGFIAQVVVAVGFQFQNQLVVLCGRFLLGSTYEALVIAAMSLLRRCNVSRVALGMAVFYSGTRLGSVSTNLVSTYIGELLGVSFAFWLGAIFLGASVVPCFLLPRVHFQDPGGSKNDSFYSSETANKPSLWKSVMNFPLVLWFLNLNCGLIYGIMFGFNTISSVFIIERYCEGSCCDNGTSTCDIQIKAQKYAAYIMCVPYLVIVLVNPLVGGFVDRCGHRGMLLVVSNILIGIVFVLVAFTNVNTSAPLTILGIASALYITVVWPSVTMVVSKNDVGAALGLAISFQNLFNTLTPIVVDHIQSITGSYQYVQYLFLGFAILGVIVATMINIIDCFTGHKLNQQAIASTAGPRPSLADIVVPQQYNERIFI